MKKLNTADWIFASLETVIVLPLQTPTTHVVRCTVVKPVLHSTLHHAHCPQLAERKKNGDCCCIQQVVLCGCNPGAKHIAVLQRRPSAYTSAVCKYRDTESLNYVT